MSYLDAKLEADTPVFSSGEIWSIATLLNENGVNADHALGTIGLNFDSLHESSHQVTFPQVIGMHRYARSQSPPYFYEIDLGSRLHLTAYGPAGFAIMSSRSFADALDVINRFWTLFNLRHSIVTIQMPENQTRLRFKRRVELPDDIAGPSLLLDICKVLVMLRDLFGSDMVPQSISVPACPEKSRQAFAAFAGCEVVEGSYAYIGLPSSQLDRPHPLAHDLTYRANIHECEKIISRYRRIPPLLEKVRRQITDLTCGAPALSEIAGRLAMSERTLRRRLQDLGTSYTAIIEDIRFESAKELLMLGTLTIEQIAERLGYTETANFRHAFRRWAGCSPQAFRLSQQDIATA